MNPRLPKYEHNKEHKFFERTLDNDLSELSSFLLEKYEDIVNGKILKGEPTKLQKAIDWHGGSVSTANYHLFNAFQFYHESLFNLAKSIKEMLEEACEYYEISKDEKFYMASWFTVIKKENNGILWHDHVGNGAPYFTGYYCVNAEPSKSFYKIGDFLNPETPTIEVINKNNRATLSETGNFHMTEPWDFDEPRITVAYDILPLRDFNLHKMWQEQHWIPII